MRNITIAPGEYYHIYNRAVNKQVIFHDLFDYARFLFLILYLQSPIVFPQIGRVVAQFVKSRAFDTKNEGEIVKGRIVELISFCIMPNHFHLIVKESNEGGIATYMQRVLTSYSKYYNAKYEKSGHVFQGPYQARHIEDDRQLLHLSAYIHRNPREISRWFNKEAEYQWSSYQDYISENRWGDLLLPNIILDQFRGRRKYHEFVMTSPAKLFENELD